MPLSGEGRRGILVVAEAPGRTEDEQGTQLVGKVGKWFREKLFDLGIDLDRDCWKTNAVCCRPPDNRTPNDKEVLACRGNVMKAIEQCKPEMILLLGGAAVKSVIGSLWRESVGKMGVWVGRQIPCQEYDAWVCPMYHPSYIIRESKPVLDLWFDRYLEEAVALEGRPWPDGLPEYEKRIECMYDPSKVAKALRGMAKTEGGVPLVFDYETNMLKPDGPDARIVSCAVCYGGGMAMAFPWHGEAVKAMGELLRAGSVKIAANMKFEERWTRRVFGHGVCNWKWDTMLAAHVLDNRRGTKSVKFLAFVMLGQKPWDEGVGPYLKADSPGVPNRIDKVPLADLLMYNGMDAIVEWEIAKIQRKEIRG